MANGENDPEPHILSALEIGNVLSDNLLLASAAKIEMFTVKDYFPRTWTRDDIPIVQRKKIGFENVHAPIDVDLVPYKLFELFLDDEFINHP